MSKSLLVAKIVGGAVAGTGTVVVGGLAINGNFKSQESSTETTPPVTNGESRDNLEGASQGDGNVRSEAESAKLNQQASDSPSALPASQTSQSPSGGENAGNSLKTDQSNGASGSETTVVNTGSEGSGQPSTKDPSVTTDQAGDAGTTRTGEQSQ